jgi:ABC-2 type transport system permease protein
MPLRRVLGAYLNEVKFESIRMLRAPGFSIPFLLLPVPVYLFFGVMLAAPAVARNPVVADYLFSGFSVFAVMGPALFGVGCVLAIEREAGLLKLKRAQPAPGGAYLIAKMTMAMVFAALAMGTVLVAALFAGRITLSASQLAIMTIVMTVGALPFAALGLFLGAYVSANVAPAIANVIFLPMLWLSGLFIPLPKFLEPWAVIWPAFHLNQVALGFAGVAEFSFMAPGISAAVLVGFTVVFGGLAIRRLARKG